MKKEEGLTVEEVNINEKQKRFFLLYEPSRTVVIVVLVVFSLFFLWFSLLRLGVVK